MGAFLLPRSRRARLAVYLILALVVVGLLAPLFGLLGRTFDVAAWLVGPVLGTPFGRLAVVNLVVLAALLASRTRLHAHFAARRRDELGAAQLELLDRLVDEPSTALAGARRVLRVARLPHGAAPWIRTQAEIALARAHLAHGEAAAAAAVLRTLDLERTPIELQRSAAQLDARLAADDGDTARLAAAIERFPHDAVILREQRRLAHKSGDLLAVCAAQARVVEAAHPAERVTERRQLAADWADAGTRSLASGEAGLVQATACVARARDADPSSPPAAVLAGDLAVRDGRDTLAMQEWSRAGTEDAWRRVIARLDAASSPFTPAELVDAVRRDAVLVLIARDALLRGDPALAERAGRVLLRRSGGSPAANALLECVARAARER
ncbi:MAG: hypothetical protein HZB39_03455 [Planctomycetes bacterium]|nr:hypothetical protein [Planctomycetota bacterium]